MGGRTVSTKHDHIRGGPAPPHLKNCPTLRYLWRLMHVVNKNTMIAIIGPPGEGKSWAALALGELLDPGFTADNVAFRPTRLLERINEDHPIGDITIADEAGVSLNAKTWWESDQIQVGNILETWRHQNRGLICTLPVFTKLQKDARGLMTVLMTAYGVDRWENKSKWRFQLIDTNPVNGDIYRPYPVLPHPKTGHKVPYKTLDLPLPSKQLRDDYQARKEAYTAEINQEALTSAQAVEDNRKPSVVAFEKIMENGGPEEYLKEANNGREYIDADLIEIDYDLSPSSAKKVKKLLVREYEGGEG